MCANLARGRISVALAVSNLETSGQRVPQPGLGQIHRAYRKANCPYLHKASPLLSCRCNCERAKTANNDALALACPCTHAQSLTHVSWCKRSRFNARKHASRDILVRQSHGLLQDDFYDSLRIASSSAVRSSSQATSPGQPWSPWPHNAVRGKLYASFVLFR